TQRYLKAKDISEDIIELPIKRQEDIRSTLQNLHKVFSFTRAPQFIFNLPPLPE
ncbi:8959_t:CDS:1, partial [Racocetra persica]